MRLKDNSVRVGNTSIGCWIGLTIANEVYKEWGLEFVWTSGDDGWHSMTSLHYNGDAADIRIYDVNNDVLVREIKSRLNIDYDVLLEDNHIHLEFQPRRR